MGFGMVRKVYMRKPRKAFAKLREVYGEEIKNYKIEVQQKEVRSLSPQEKLIIRNRIADRKRKDTLREIKTWIISLAFLGLFAFVFVKLFIWFFG
jgi:hypothetical protein